MNKEVVQIDAVDQELQTAANHQADSGPVLAKAQAARAMAEVQAAMVIAKKFPRDENQSIARIQQACKRISLAENAVYEYPRGGTLVTGPSIRLAEVLAQNWGNIDFGILELEQREGESVVMAYAWDLETNTRRTIVFTVPHQRKAYGKIIQLNDPRDIYEMVANQAARRLRACILSVIPGDVIEMALQECDRTLAETSNEPLPQRIQKMVKAFQEIGVSKEQIEKKLGHKVEKCTIRELLRLRRWYTSIKDGMIKPEEIFGYSAIPAKKQYKHQSEQEKDEVAEAEEIFDEMVKEEQNENR